MGNAIFLSTNYEYASKVCENFARCKDMFFVSTNDIVEYELSAYNEFVDIGEVSTQTILRLLGYENCAIVMDIGYLSDERVQEQCFACKNLIYLPTDENNNVYKIAKEELDKYFSAKANYVVQKEEVTTFLKDFKLEE